MKRLENGIYEIVQEEKTCHIAVYKNGRIIFHSAYHKLLNDKELLEYLEETIRLVNALADNTVRGDNL